jgi:hypothetical protein
MFPYLGIEILRVTPPRLRGIGGVVAMRLAVVMPLLKTGMVLLAPYNTKTCHKIQNDAALLSLLATAVK